MPFSYECLLNVLAARVSQMEQVKTMARLRSLGFGAWPGLRAELEEAREEGESGLSKGPLAGSGCEGEELL
jgi:hypothetical protein